MIPSPTYFYGRKQGKPLSPTRRQQIHSLLESAKITDSPQAPLWKEGLPWGARKCWMEIGFGKGEQLVELMRANPQDFFIGCEVFLNGLGNLAAQLSKDLWPNLALYTQPIQTLLPHLPSSALDGIFVFFPDPWPKLRHQKRRLFQLSFLQTCHRILRPGGSLYIATDHDDYWHHMQSVAASPQSPLSWVFRSTCRQTVQVPLAGFQEIHTHYEKKALAKGKTCHYGELKIANQP